MVPWGQPECWVLHSKNKIILYFLLLLSRPTLCVISLRSQGYIKSPVGFQNLRKLKEIMGWTRILRLEDAASQVQLKWVHFYKTCISKNKQQQQTKPFPIQYSLPLSTLLSHSALRHKKPYPMRWRHCQKRWEAWACQWDLWLQVENVYLQGFHSVTLLLAPDISWLIALTHPGKVFRWM